MKRVFLFGRFLHLTSPTGPEQYSLSLHRQFAQNDSVTAYEYFYDGTKYTLWQKLFGRINRKDDKVTQIGLFPFMLELLRLRPAVLHITMFERFPALLLWLKKLLGIKLVYTCHGVVSSENAAKTFIPAAQSRKDAIAERMLLQSADRIITFSFRTEEMLLSEYPGTAGILHRSMPAVANELTIKRIVRPVRKKLKIVCVGGFSQREIDTVQLIGKLLPLAAVCEFQLIDFNETHVKQLAPEFTARTLPRLANTEFITIIGSYDCILTAYAKETFSLATLEAMALGTIPVCIKSAGISAHLTNGTDALLFDEEDIPALIEALQHLQADINYRESLSAATRMTAQKFSSTAMMNDHESVYASLEQRR